MDTSQDSEKQHNNLLNQLDKEISMCEKKFKDIKREK